jgi:hypothetical protein
MTYHHTLNLLHSKHVKKREKGKKTRSKNDDNVNQFSNIEILLK